MIYDIVFSAEASKLAPPSKRTAWITAFLSSCLKPLQWLRDLIWGDYLNGSGAAFWNVGTSYPTAGIRVNYFDKAVYETTVAGTPIGTLPINTDYWYRVSDSFLGAKQRLNSNGQTWILQGNDPTGNAGGLLNKWFRIDFAPFIYIQTNNIVSNFFYVGATEAESSTVGAMDSSGFIRNVNPSTGLFDFTLKVPSIFYASLGSPSEADSILRSFLDQYILAGINYNITTY